MELNELEKKFEKSISVLIEDLSAIRANKVSPTFLKPVCVLLEDGQKVNLMDIALVRVINAKTLGVKPWEHNQCSAIDKAIRSANLGLNVGMKEDELLVSFPELTQERRKEIVKSLNTYALNTKNAIRAARNDFIKANKKNSKEEEIKQEKDIQKLVDKYNTSIDNHIASKEKEIMQL